MRKPPENLPKTSRKPRENLANTLGILWYQCSYGTLLFNLIIMRSTRRKFDRNQEVDDDDDDDKDDVGFEIEIWVCIVFSVMEKLKRRTLAARGQAD